MPAVHSAGLKEVRMASNFNQYYDKLNPSQKKAVDITDGALLILAGPGTGKTELLSVRAANIIRQEKARPENILILTYTNAAAKAMKERLIKILGSSGYDIETGTFHSFANSIILESEEAANYIQDKVQLEEIEQVRLLEYIFDNTEGIDPIRPFRAPYFYRKSIQGKISELKKDGITPKDFANYIKTVKPDSVYLEDKHIPRLKALAQVYKLYEEYKNGKNEDIFDERGRYDYDDMIIFALEAVKAEKELKRMLHSQYTHIMVDEFQDTNGAQMNLLFELINPKEANLCCVGDDDQSIYRFQGASVGNFRIFKERFPGCRMISLNDNYRSSDEIIELADKIIKHLPENERVAVKKLNSKKSYKDKTIEFHEFTTEAEELLFIADKVKELKGVIEKAGELTPEEASPAYNNIAILVRKRDHILKLIDTFLRAGIPYATDKETDISSEKRVQQMIDALKLAHMSSTVELSEKDAVFYRVITSDYFRIRLNDILRFINYVMGKRRRLKEKGVLPNITLFSEFMFAFATDDKSKRPTPEQALSSKIAKELKLEDAHSIHLAVWAIQVLMGSAEAEPVHAVLMRYVKNAGIYKYILEEYDKDRIARIRELRALSSFIRMVNETNLRNPGMRLADFIDELETKKEHGMGLAGSLVTETQEGVRIFTAHGSKGLEFHTIILPFCIENKNWPVKPRGDLLPFPPEIFRAKERVKDKLMIRQLSYYDEIRLFYVASTRAKSHLIYTATPSESAISSSYLANIGLYSVRSESQMNSEEDIMVRSLELTDTKDPFIGTEAVLADLVSNITLNPTSLNNYINCKRKFLYDNLLMLPSEKKLGLTFGNCVHKALEDTYRYLIGKGRFPAFRFFKEAFERELIYQGVEHSIKKGCLRQVDTLKEWFERESKAPIVPIGLENKLKIMLDEDLVFTGKYDKTEILDEKKKLVRVVDYKTGSPDGHIKDIVSGSKDLSSDECDGYFRQLVAYKLLFDKQKLQNKGFKVSHGMLVFVEPAKKSVIKYGLKKGEFINRTIEITDNMVSELEEAIRNCWRSIKKLDFEKLPEKDEDVKKCGGCVYRNICWS